MIKTQLVGKAELIASNVLQIEAIVRILVRKGITTEDEILNELRKIQSEMNDKLNQSKKLN